MAELSIKKSGKEFDCSVVMQSTSFCNISCAYCYLSNKSVRNVMDLRIVEATVDRLEEFLDPQNKIEVIWHAGEPLTLPIGWYSSAFANFFRLEKRGNVVNHRIQTNGTLITPEWASFFKKHRVRVGLSVDGPRHVHNKSRKRRSGDGTHDAVVKSAHLLKAAGVKYDALAVITSDSLDHAKEIFEFFGSFDARMVSLNIDEKEGENILSSFEKEACRLRFRSFIRDFFRWVWASHGKIRSRELDDAISILGSSLPVSDAQNIPLSIISIAYDGGISTFSPELLGLDHKRYGNFKFGNILSNSIDDLLKNADFQRIAAEIETGKCMCARKCSYYRQCGGGAPVNKLYENDSFASSSTLNCILTRQIVLDEAQFVISEALYRANNGYQVPLNE